MSIDDESYSELLLGKKPNKDPRWNRYKGLTIALNIVRGRCKKGYAEAHLATRLFHLRDQLIKEINAEKRHG